MSFERGIERLGSLPTKPIVRTAIVVSIVFLLSVLLYGYTSYSMESDLPAADDRGWQGDPPDGTVTVVTTSERTSDGERDNALLAFSEHGEVLYSNDSLRVYNDVDPVASERSTVLYVGAEHLDRSECHATTACWLNVVETVNLSTGEVTRVYSQVTPLLMGQWHDVDRIDESRLLVADIALDRVFIVNTTSGIVEWEWNAQSEFALQSGGWYPNDWTHLNDVEALSDGRVMVSLRNQDQVVFVDRQRGLASDWTLGADDDHGVLYEQHNPDFIPRERGGAAVLVANSERNRIVEYRRTEAGEWVQTWTWEDPRLMWPRDADRLSNGNTLITDTNGGRVLEVDRRGRVVWSVPVEGAYDAERLGTGDESTGGRSATALNLVSHPGSPPNAERSDRTATSTAGLTERGLVAVKAFLPPVVANALLYVLPAWIGFVEFLSVLLLGAIAIGWIAIEAWWSSWSVRISRTRPDDR